MNRKNAPKINPIGNVDFLLPEKWKLSNGVEVWELNAGSQELVKIDFIFEAGTFFQTQNLVAGLTNAFLNQGSKNYSAQDIAEAFDFRGAYLQLSADQHFGTVSVLTLNKYIEEILKVTADVILHPIFPEKELATQIKKKKQQFVIENSKVKTLAQKKYSQVVFGEKHGYSNTNRFEDYDLLRQEMLKSFHQKFYGANNCKVLLAGKTSAKIRDLLETYFGENNWPKQAAINEHINVQIESSMKRSFFVEKADALQSAIRMGSLMPNRNHSDFHGLNVLTTLLGGYFGSRLMANIREDKGYTYGVGAYIYSLPEAAYLSISTEVGTEVTQQALHEIYREIEILQNELVAENELEIVRNYLLGENLRSFDGVFAMSSSLRTLIEMGLDYQHFSDFITKVRSIDTREIQRLAQVYLKKESLKEVVSGKTNPW